MFEAEGFRCDSLLMHEKTVQNRALEISMERRWIQAVFTYMGSARSPVPGGLGVSPPLNPTPGLRHPQPSAAEEKGEMMDWRGDNEEAEPLEAASEACSRGGGEKCEAPGTRYSPTAVEDPTETAAARAPLRQASDSTRSTRSSDPLTSPLKAHAAAGALGGIESGGGACLATPAAGGEAEQQEWEGSVVDGVLGSDVGSMFQEPIEMVHELVTLRPGLTVKVRAPLSSTY